MGSANQDVAALDECGGEAAGWSAIFGSAFAFCHLVLDTMSLSWAELERRTWRRVVDDDVLGLAAQLLYYLFLALLTAILFPLVVASFFPLSNITDDIGRSLDSFVSPQVLELIQTLAMAAALATTT